MQPDFENDGEFMAAEPAGSPTLSAATPTLTIPGRSRSWLVARWRQYSAWFQSAFIARSPLPAPWSHPAFGYIIAVLGQIVMINITILLLRTFPAFRFPSALLLLVVLLTSLGWGLGPGLVATLLGTILLLTLPSPFALAPNLVRTEDVLGIFLYTVVGFIISLLTSRAQQERQMAQALSQRLNTILETLPDPLIIYDLQGQPIQQNQSAREMFSSEQSLSLDQMPQRLLKQNRNNEPASIEDLPATRALRGEHINGSELHFSAWGNEPERVVVVSAAPLRSSTTGTIEGAITIMHDLTALLQTEREARNQANELEAIVEALPEALYVYDLTGKAIRRNLAGRLLLERATPSSLAGFAEKPQEQSAISTDEQASTGSLLLPVERLLNGEVLGPSKAVEVTFPSLDGGTIHSSVTGAPLRDQDGQITGAVTICRDVTDYRRIEEALGASEERYRIIVQTAHEGIWLVDLEAHTLYANDHMAHLLDTSPAELLKHTVLDFVYPEDEQTGRARIGSNLQGQFEQFEFRFRRQDGSELYTQAATSPVRDSSGQIVGALGMFTDITTRRQMERSLKQSEELLRIALKNSPITVYQQDRDLRYTWMYNPLPTFTPEEIVGKTDADFMPDDEVAHLTRIKRQVLATGVGIREEIRASSVAGIHFIDLTIEPLREGSGEIIGVTGAAIDITERKHLEDDLQRLELEARESASELEALFEAMTDSIFVYNKDGKIQRMNAEARKLLARYSPPEVLSVEVQKRSERLDPRSTDGTAIPPEYVPAVRMLHGEVLTGSKAADVLLRTLAGDDLWLNMSGTPLRDETGQITGAIAIAHDVTERRQLERRTRTVLEALLQMAQILVQGFDSHKLLDPETNGPSREVMQRLGELTRNVLGCSRLGITGIDPETELLGPLAVVGLSPEQEREWWKEQEQQSVRLSESPDTALLERFLAQEIIILDMTQPPYNAQPNPYGIQKMLIAPIALGSRMLGFFTMDYGGLDHTYTPDELELTKAVTRFAALVMERERLITEAALARANELAARETTRQLDEFVGIASHELKTPLTSIKGNLQLAVRQVAGKLKKFETVEGKEQSKFAELRLLLERAEHQVNVQNRLVSDLVDMARIRTERLELRLEKVDLISIVREVVEDQSLMTGDRPLIVELPRGERVPVIADAVRVEQVVGNYLSNALKYSPTNRPIEVRLLIKEGQARVEVIDQGPGFSQEEQERIWKRFYRIPGMAVQSGSSVGLGLGLHISRMLIEQHGGQVGVESSPGQGATFWFTLPLAETSGAQSSQSQNGSSKMLPRKEA